MGFRNSFWNEVILGLRFDERIRKKPDKNDTKNHLEEHKALISKNECFLITAKEIIMGAICK